MEFTENKCSATRRTRTSGNRGWRLAMVTISHVEVPTKVESSCAHYFSSVEYFDRVLVDDRYQITLLEELSYKRGHKASGVRYNTLDVLDLVSGLSGKVVSKGFAHTKGPVGSPDYLGNEVERVEVDGDQITVYTCYCRTMSDVLLERGPTRRVLVPLTRIGAG